MQAFIMGRVSHLEQTERDGKTKVTIFVQQPKEIVKLTTNPADLAQWGPANDLEVDGPKYSWPVEIRNVDFNGRTYLTVQLAGQVTEVVTRNQPAAVVGAEG